MKEVSDKCMLVTASPITYVQHVSVPEVVLGGFPPLVQSNVLRCKALQQLQDLCYHLIHLCSIVGIIYFTLMPVTVSMTANSRQDYIQRL